MRCKVLYCEYRECLDYCVPPPQPKVWRYKEGVNLMRAKIKKGKIRICVLVHLKNLISLFLAVKVY